MEKTATYTTGFVPSSLDEFKVLNCAKHHAAQEYEPPTPDQVRLLIKLTGWTQKDIGMMTGMQYSSKGCRMVSRWTSLTNPVQVPFLTWRYLLNCAGVVRDDVELLTSLTSSTLLK